MTLREKILAGILVGLCGFVTLGILCSYLDHKDDFRPSIAQYAEPETDLSGLERATRSTVTIKAVNEFGGSTGSGVVLSEDGYILTCAHLFCVTKNITSRDITVHLYNDPIDYKVKIIGMSTDLDLALLKIKNLPRHKLDWVQVANPKTTRVGMNIYVIGSPLGLDWTVSKGIVSKLHRPFGQVDWLQFDAPATFGNSGGPIVNERGELVGIVSRMLLNPSDSLKFAVSEEHIIEFIEKLFK